MKGKLFKAILLHFTLCMILTIQIFLLPSNMEKRMHFSIELIWELEIQNNS